MVNNSPKKVIYFISVYVNFGENNEIGFFNESISYSITTLTAVLDVFVMRKICVFPTLLRF